MKRAFAPSKHEALQAGIALEVALAEAEISIDYRMIVGKRYMFFCEHGSHTRTMVGTITAIEYSDEAGLELYVSNPTFWGIRLICFRWSVNDACWKAYVEDRDPNFFERSSGDNDWNRPIGAYIDREEDARREQESQREIDEHIASLYYPGRLILI